MTTVNPQIFSQKTSSLEIQFERLKEQNTIRQNGWEKIKEETFNKFESFLKLLKDIPIPSCYPTQEGNLDAEWSVSNGWEISIETISDLKPKENFEYVLFALNIKTDESIFNFYDIAGNYVSSLNDSDHYEFIDNMNENIYEKLKWFFKSEQEQY